MMCLFDWSEMIPQFDLRGSSLHEISSMAATEIAGERIGGNTELVHLCWDIELSASNGRVDTQNFVSFGRGLAKNTSIEFFSVVGDSDFIADELFTAMRSFFENS
jgi:hypothetical protein